MKNIYKKIAIFWIALAFYLPSFAQTDTLCNPNEIKKYYGETFLNYGSVTNAYSTFNRSDFTGGQPLISPTISQSQKFQVGFGLWISWLLPPQAPTLKCSQGDFKDRIVLGWEVNPLGPVPTSFVIYRDGSFLTELSVDVRQFIDFYTQAGEFYEYSIVAKNIFGQGTPFKAIGFMNPNGVVTGKVTTNSGNSVPGVEVRLSPITGSSMIFDGVNDQLCVSYNSVLSSSSFTVSAYVKLGANNTTGIIDAGSNLPNNLHKNWWITTTNSSEGKGYIFNIGNGSGSTPLKYIIPNEITNPELPDQWHQITMVYNGTAMSAMVDGNFVGTVPAVISREKSLINIGSLVNDTKYFAGKIDDIRIYNRALSQSEVMQTKNRTLSKTETGLVAYWKMDEGVGLKNFDISNNKLNTNIYGGATFSSDIPEVYNAGVTDATGFYTIDGINYTAVESFRATPMKSSYKNSALEFNAADKSYADLTNYDIPDSSTIEVLFYPFDLKSRQTVLSKGSLYELYVDNAHLWLKLNGLSATDLGIITAKYNHFAVVLNNSAGTATVYLDGELKTTVSFTGQSDWASSGTTAWLAGTNSTDAATGKFYTGLIDEIIVYNGFLSQAEIQTNGNIGTAESNPKIYSYYSFNDATGNSVYDYAAVNTPLKMPRIGTIKFAKWSINVKTNSSTPHEFEPNQRVVNINKSNTAVGNIDFRDVSTINVSGYVRFDNTTCYTENVEILVNGVSNIPAIHTNANGFWSADFEPGASVKLSAVYKDHKFTPSFMEFRNLQAPKAGIVFLNNTKRKVTGQIAGGLCKKSIIPTGSRVVVKIEATNGCFSQEKIITNPDGKYTFDNLPALNFTVKVIEHSNNIIYTYFQNKGGTETDLREVTADTVDFIYTAPPQVKLQAFTSTACVGGDPMAFIDQTTNKNNYRLYKTDVQVYEEYTGPTVERCYLNHFDLTIDNTIADKSIYSVTSDSLHYLITYPAGLPNLVAPYKKILSVTATVNGGSSNPELVDVVVLGEVSLPNTFTTATPQIPMYILRDPPGDGSSATIAAGTTLCNSMSNAKMTSATGGVNVLVDLGAKVTTYAGTPFFGVITEAESVFNVNIAGTFGAVNSSENTIETCTTIMRSYSTSSGDQIIGEDADLYVGSAINFKVGGTRELTYNPTTCSFELANNVRMFPDGFSTFFTYSEYQIKTDIIPTLTSLGKTADAKKWKDIVEYNHTLKKNAVLKENLSFDALAQINDQLTIERTISQSITSEINWTASMNTTIGFEVFSVGTEVTVSVDLGGSNSTTRTTAGTTTRTVSYTLADNDVGDKFTVNIKEDKVYQTPVFELVAGTTSCPWEPNTRHRSQPSLISKDGNVATNVSANTPAVFELQLGNLSPTQETMEYEISMVTGTNPDGSIVKIDGQNIIATPIKYSIPYGESRKVLLTIARGPIAYNYTGIIIVLKNTCETNDEIFAKELAFNVSFIEPCSTVDIGFPLQDWVVTPAANNVLNITLNEYDNTDPDLELIRVQYRRIGGDGAWINITDVLKADLGGVFKIVQWNTGLLKDGEYEIRAITQCVNTSLAAGVSTIVKGSVQRLPPELVGKPEPADGVWDPGDEISITFNEAIDCDKVFQADMLSNNTIGLYDATTNLLVNATISCVGNRLIIVPNINPKDFENRTFRVKVSGTESNATIGIQDKVGNKMVSNIIWEFNVNQNSLEWVGNDIIETNVVLHPFSVKRQIRNRGGTIMQFRMEDLPFWLTISPSTGTLNPGQTADITFTFQQDMLIGDYLTTINMVGSQGKEPLKIDYRVRCQPPVWEVQNVNEFSGSMNMVVKLNIFGQQSMDPSDIIIAKIDNQIRGVGNVSYYRSLNQWLAFITIYGNDIDTRKDIVFNVWDGSACSQYSEVLEAISYNDGDLIGSPINPQNLNVINLVQKCIPLAKGWNWVSVNLDMLDNSVTNVLKSLKHKNSTYYIKDDDNSSRYYTQNNLGWQGSLDTLRPKKRYMIYLDQKDTLCIKGKPYIAPQNPISIVKDWNWIGYIPQTGMTVTQALAGLTPLNGDLIKDQSRFAQYVAGIGWVGNLSFLEAPKGYLLKISNPGTLIFPTSTANNFNGNGLFIDSNTESLTSSGALGFDFRQYTSTMNSVAKVKGISIEPEDELRAYIKGELRGVVSSGNYTGAKEKESLFFMTIYSNDVEKVEFRLYKADRKKEYNLQGNTTFEGDKLVGLVENPFILTLPANTLPTIQIAIENQVITQPSTTFSTVSVPNSLVGSASCGNFSFNTILPTGTTTQPTCTLPTGYQNNMTGTIKVIYNERSNFAHVNDRLTFTNPANNQVVGCGTTTTIGGQILFNFTVKGDNSSTPIPIDVSYYSFNLKTTFLLKSGVNYLKDVILGDIITPQVLDFAPLKIIMDTNGVITATFNDPNWTGKYCVDVFAMNCPSNSDGTTIFCFQRLKVIDCVELTASNNSAICSGNNLTLTSAQGGASYAWQGPNSFVSTNRKPIISGISNLGTGIYTVTATHSSGCTSTATTSVTIYSLPVTTASNNSPICVGTSLNLVGGGIGTAYAWTGPNNFTSSQQSPSIPNASVAATGSYRITVTNANGCTNAATTSVTVNANPTAMASSNSPICVGKTLTLIGGGTETAYAWNGPNNFSSSQQSPNIPNAVMSASGNYTLTVMNANGCTNSITTSVTVNANPLPTASSNSPICVGTSLILTGGGTETAYAWTGPNNFTSSQQSPSLANSTLAAMGNYTLMVTNVNGCTSTIMTSVTVNINSVATASNNSPLCDGTSLSLTGGGIGTAYAWTGANNFTSSQQNPTIANAGVSATGNYILTVTNANGCTSLVTTSVTVKANPTAMASSNSPIYAKTTLNLTSAGGGTYAWVGPNLFNSTSQNPSVTNVSTAASGIYTLTVTTNGCTNLATTSVTVYPAVIIYVNKNNTNIIQDGTDWTKAFSNLQSAIATASAILDSPVEIWVAKGVYKPTANTDRSISFSPPSGVKMYGGFVGTETLVAQRNFRTNETLLSGDIGTVNLMTDNSSHVMKIIDGNNQTLIDGFSIKDGYAIADPSILIRNINPLEFLTSVSIESGGAIFIQNSSPTIANCIIQNNAAVFGGAIYSEEKSVANVKFCYLSGNSATFGGGMFNFNSNSILSNMVISGNKALGGAMYNNNSSPTITNVTISGNDGTVGGIFNTSSCIPIIKNSIIWNNSGPTNSLSKITYSIVEGGYLGVGNMNLDPKFVSLQPYGVAPISTGNYHVLAGSPSNDMGENGLISTTDIDLDGNLRRNGGGVVDIGAYEFNGFDSGMIISITSGNWEDTSTWNLNRTPTLTDQVIINVNHTVTINSIAEAKSLEYRTNAMVNFGNLNAKLKMGF